MSISLHIIHRLLSEYKISIIKLRKIWVGILHDSASKPVMRKCRDWDIVPTWDRVVMFCKKGSNFIGCIRKAAHSLSLAHPPCIIMSKWVNLLWLICHYPWLCTTFAWLYWCLASHFALGVAPASFWIEFSCIFQPIL